MGGGWEIQLGFVVLIIGYGGGRAGGWWSESGNRRRAKVHFKRRDLGQGFVGNGVVGKTDALSERGPNEIVRRRQEFHCPVPVPPPTFDFAVALGIVSACGCPRCAGGSRDGREQFGEEFGGRVRVDNVQRTTAKENFI